MLPRMFITSQAASATSNLINLYEGIMSKTCARGYTRPSDRALPGEKRTLWLPSGGGMGYSQTAGLSIGNDTFKIVSGARIASFEAVEGWTAREGRV